jgi:macrolide transport system ATP-binding/permease protein
MATLDLICGTESFLIRRISVSAMLSLRLTRMVFREAGWLAAIGIAIGSVCSVATSTLMRGLLFGVQAWDFSTLAVVATLLVVSALVASYIPAHRAASVNPVQALHAE